MQRLIDANAAADKIIRDTEAHAYEIGVGGVALMIGFVQALRDETNFPTIDAQPVRHGRWIDAHFISGNDFFRCSECGCYIEKIYFANDYNVRYCPDCGAKMEEGEGDAGTY